MRPESPHCLGACQREAPHCGAIGSRRRVPSDTVEKAVPRQERKLRFNRFRYGFETFLGDLSGALTATVVSLPFALAFGVASGLGAAAGLYGSIAVGFFAAAFGGSRTVISGPAPSVTVAMAVIVTTHATSLSEAFTVVVMGGLIQILLGLSGLGRFVAYTPYVVMSGVMSGIGLIIVLVQIAPFFGSPAVPGGAIPSLWAIPQAITNFEPHAVLIAAATLATVVLWPGRLARLLPPPLVALVAGSLLGVLWLTDAPTIGSIPSALPKIQLAAPSVEFVVSAIEPALILALLGSIDSLLACMVADSLTGTRHDANRELSAQGFGNVVAGLVGGLPGAGASVSTATNIRAGGLTRVSGVLRALFLLALVLGFGHLVEPIPHAVLAAILLKVGWSLIDWDLLGRARHLRREHLIVILTTLALTVFVDLITAVAVGLIVAGMAHARKLEHFELESVISIPLRDRTFFADHDDMARADPYSARVGLVALKGGFTVASSKKLVDVIGADIKDHEVVIFDFSGTTYLDDSAAKLIGELLDIAKEQRTRFILIGFSDAVAQTLFAFGVLQRIPEGCVVETMEHAREAAYRFVAEERKG